MIRFEHTDFLLGLILIPFLVFLFFYLLQWKKQTARKIGDPHLVKELVKNYSPLKFSLKFVLILLGFAVCVVAAANLQKPAEGGGGNRKGVDIMIALDVSKSMLAEDFPPSRLERARQLVNRLMTQLPNDRIGIVLFAGRAYLQMPLTTDHSAARMYIQQAGPGMVPTQGTAIGEAMRIANTSFNTKERKFKAIVLISDGEDHDEDAVQIAKTLTESGVMINTVGIGSTDGAVIIDPETGVSKKDLQGNTVITKLNETLLQQIAAASNGTYVKLDDTDAAVQQIVDQLRTIEQKSLQDAALIDYKSFFQWFVAAALLLLIVELLIPERKKVVA
ncbi:MAG TPA: VWA domain-containing protein [Chitinophagaceae bacterium]|nr:VWA domain-containing protein [Chitinophagaceae bacterium]